MRIPKKLAFVVLAAVALSLMLWAFAGLASAQTTSGPSMDDFLKALSGHQWTIAAAAFSFLAVSAMKQGYFSTWLATHLPAKAKPAVAFLIAAVTLAAPQIAHGAPVLSTIAQALYATGLAVLGHQMLVEGARSGKEIVPPTKKVAALSVVPDSKS